MITNYVDVICKYVLTVCTFILIGLAPFFMGLFFEREMSIHHYLVAAVSLLVPMHLIYKSFNMNLGNAHGSNQKLGSVGIMIDRFHPVPVRQLITSPYFWVLAALVALYGLSFLQSINPREALFVWLRHIDYFLSFVLVFLVTGMWEKDRQVSFVYMLFVVFSIAGTAVAVGGILAGQGIGPIQYGVAYGRLASTLQYPNSLAAYLMAIVLMVNYLAIQNIRPYIAGAFAGMSFLVFLALWGTQSQGVWLLMPVILFLYILGQTVRKKLVLLLAGNIGLAIILGDLTVSSQVQELQPNWGALIWTLAGCLISGIAWGVFVSWNQRANQPIKANKKTKKKSSRVKVPTDVDSSETGTQKNKIAVFGIGLAILVIAAGMTIFVIGQDTSILGNQLTRIIEDENLQGRLVFYNDAVKMISDRPLLGWGGGGWRSGYYAYQSFNYISTVVHSHFLQVWVEVGTLGFILFVFLFIALSYSLWNIYRIRTTHTLAPETWTLGTAALALGIHSIIDFDLTFSSIALLLWALIASFAYREKIMRIGFFKRKEINKMPQGERLLGEKGTVVLIMIFTICFALASTQLAANTYLLRSAAAKEQEFNSAIKKGNLREAGRNIQAAIRLDRWSARYPILQAQFLTVSLRNIDPQIPTAMTSEKINLVNRAVELDSYNQKHRFYLARLYLADNQLEKALDEAEQAKKLKPWFIETYEQFSSICVDVAVQQLLQDQGEAAHHTLSRVMAVVSEAVNKKDTLPPKLKKLWNKRSDLILTHDLALSAGKSALLMEDHIQASEYLLNASQADDPKTKISAQIWLGVALLKSGDLSGEDLIEETRQSSLDAEKEYSLLKQLVEW